MRSSSIYTHRSPTSLLQSFIILLCNAGLSVTVNHHLGNGQAGASRAPCPQHKAASVERWVCSCVTLQKPTTLKCVPALGREGMDKEIGQKKQGAAWGM